jgi:hypothetical protein
MLPSFVRRTLTTHEASKLRRDSIWFSARGFATVRQKSGLHPVRELDNRLPALLVVESVFLLR